MSDKPIYDEKHNGYRVFVGDVSPEVSKYMLINVLRQFGEVIDCWIARSPPGFGFAVFKSAKEADRAVHARRGKWLHDRDIHVEHAVPVNHPYLKAPLPKRYQKRPFRPSERSHRSPPRRSPRHPRSRRLRSRSRSHSSTSPRNRHFNKHSPYGGGYSRDGSRDSKIEEETKFSRRRDYRSHSRDRDDIDEIRPSEPILTQAVNE
ncbi:hypothetical protein SNEBB_005786 [Seison nebaliae]|nr:hypothetical protein SNEBB_005786 [Seison nebaliae]